MSEWPTRALGEVATLYGGGTPKRDNPLFWNGDIEWVTPTDLPTPEEGISIVSMTRDHITEAGLATSSATRIPKDTVLFSSRATIGKVGVAAAPLTTNQGFANFVPGPEITPRYLAYVLWYRREDIARFSGSTTFKEVSRSTLRQYKIPVPPLAEQERIVKLLDEADAIRKLRAQADQRTADLIPALFHEMFGDPVTNPMGWPNSTLGEGCIKLTDGTHRSPPGVLEGIPYITARHLKETGLQFFDSPTYVSKESHAEIYSRCDPVFGDILYIKDGATTGIAAINRYDFEFSMLSSLALLRPDPTICNSEFLCCYLNHPGVKESMLSNMAGAAIRRLTLVKIRSARLITPPIELQQDFEGQAKKILSLHAVQESERQAVNGLFASALGRLFLGEY